MGGGHHTEGLEGKRDGTFGAEDGQRGTLAGVHGAAGLLHKVCKLCAQEGGSGTEGSVRRAHQQAGECGGGKAQQDSEGLPPSDWAASGGRLYKRGGPCLVRSMKF